MEPETPAPPPEARLIRTAREAVGMTAAQAAQATEGAVSATYWRDVERGYGGRRGVRAAARASSRLLAAMARVTGVTPEQLKEAQREDAARVLAEIQRREAPHGPALRMVPPVSGLRRTWATGMLREILERHPELAPEILRDALHDFPDDPALQALGAQTAKDAKERMLEILKWLDFLTEHPANVSAGLQEIG